MTTLGKTLRVLAAAAWLGVVSASMGVAAEPENREQALHALQSGDPESRLEALVWMGARGTIDDLGVMADALRDEDSDVRTFAEGALVQMWSRSGEQQIDGLLKTGIKQMGEGHIGQAIATFSRIVELRPDFAEGWNKRATAYYLMGSYDLSLKDCDEVMRRNPYHFGALAGFGMNYLRLGKMQEALEYFERALEVNPNLDGARMSVDAIRQKLGIRGRQSI